MPISIITTSTTKKKRRPRRPRLYTYRKKFRMTVPQLKAAIAKVKEDNANLKLQIQAKETVYPADETKRARLTDLETEFLEKVNLAERQRGRLAARVGSIDEEVLEAKAQMGGVHSSSQERHRLQNQLQVLENRLDRMLAAYNSSIARNKSLREQIETLREERGVFDGIKRKLEVELEQKKALMAQSIEMSNAAFEEADDAKADLENLRREKKTMVARHNVQIQILDDLLKQAESLRSDTNRRLRANTLSLEDSRRLKNSVARTRLVGMAKVGRAGDLEDRLAELERRFGILTDQTQVESVERLIEVFEEHEENSFSLYRHSTELNSEMQELQTQINDIEDQVVSYISGDKSTIMRVKNRRLLDLQRGITETERKLRTLEANRAGVQGLLEEVFSGIKNMFLDVEADKKLIIEKLGEFAINPNNAMQFLSLTEQQLDRLLRIYAETQNTRVPIAPVTSTSDNVNMISSSTDVAASLDPSEMAAAKKRGAGAGGSGPRRGLRKKFTIRPPTSIAVGRGDEEDGARGGGGGGEEPLTREDLEFMSRRKAMNQLQQ